MVTGSNVIVTSSAIDNIAQAFINGGLFSYFGGLADFVYSQRNAVSSSPLI